MKNKGTKQKTKKKGSENAFGCDLIEHLQNSGQDVPQVLKKCAEFIEKHGIVDGIYRLSGVTSNIQRLRQEFCSEACPDLTKEVYLQDIHCVGSLCKLYFRELPNPLLTYELYSKFTEVVSVQDDHERLLHIQKVIKELPTAHFRTLEYLAKHLSHLATLSTQTNMHTRNLALVWAPNLLRSKDIEASSGNGDMAFQEVRIQQSVVEFILNHADQIFRPVSKCGEKYATLPISGQCGPMKLMSLEEAQARSLSPDHPLHKERQRENSLPDTSTATLYHTVIDISDNKRKFSGKSKKWKSIFNIGRSLDPKGKLSRNGSVLIRAQGMTEKAALRPSRSMESLTGSNSPAGGPGSIFIPDVKSRTLGSDSLCDISEHDQNWEFKGKNTGGATGGWNVSENQKGSEPPQKNLPEQLKVFKGDDLGGYKPTSPKNRRMLYSASSHNSSSRPSFPGSFFPLESSPRHQRRAVNISEPFAVSVPLRVSAVISSNSTPCRGHGKEKAATLKPCKETSEQSGNSGKSNTFPQLERKRQERRSSTGKDLWSDLNQELKITEPEFDLLDENAKRSRSSPSLSLLCREQSSNTSRSDCEVVAKKQPSESDILLSLHKTAPPTDTMDEKEKKLNLKIPPLNKDNSVYTKQSQLCPKKASSDQVINHLRIEDVLVVADNIDSKSHKHEIPQENQNAFSDGAKNVMIPELEIPQRLPVCLEEKRNTLELPNLDDDEGGTSEELDLVEPWEDISSTKQWVTSPLHSPDLEHLFNHLSPFSSHGETLSLEVEKSSSPQADNNKFFRSTECSPGNLLQTTNSKPETTWMYVPSAPTRSSLNSNSTTQPQTEKCSTTKSKNTASSQRFNRQMSYEAAASEKREEKCFSKHRPCSLNLDLGHRYIRDISNQQNRTSSEFSSCQRGLMASSGAVNNGLPSELELFLNDRQAPLRRNSAPVSVSSVRTAFMIKTCQAKAVPVIPPKVQYSQIPHCRPENEFDRVKEQEKENPKVSTEKSNAAPPPSVSDLKEELENKEPAPILQKQPSVEKSAESLKISSTPELPVITRRHTPSLEVFVDCPRPSRGNLLQRPSFRNRQRPQSLILLSPPFPIMDYPTSGDDGKLLSPIKSLNDASAANVFSKEMAENFRTTEGIALQNKMTIPKSGQRLETSTSCFYQPQRRSMIFDSRSHRQIE
uniref:Rho-GAP domain-containing protein n=1 Tax=Astatotilapia calliptera TaxID=8154 RepID=A0AAX7UUP2_ASTCA